MKTIIIEDEPLVAKDLQKLVLQIDPSIEILIVLDSVQSCISYFTSNPELFVLICQLSPLRFIKALGGYYLETL